MTSSLIHFFLHKTLGIQLKYKVAPNLSSLPMSYIW